MRSPKGGAGGHTKGKRHAEIQQVTRDYKKNPKANARKLRALGVPKHEIKRIHNASRPAGRATGADVTTSRERREIKRERRKNASTVYVQQLPSRAAPVSGQKRRYYEKHGYDPAKDNPEHFTPKQAAAAERSRRKNLGTPRRVLEGAADMPALRELSEGKLDPWLPVEVAGLIPGAGAPIKVGRGVLRALKAGKKVKPAVRASLRERGPLLKATKATARKMSFPAEMPPEVRDSAHRLARGLDKPKVKALRAQQEKLYSAERGKRAHVAEAALKKHAGTPHAIRIAKSKLAGELPKVNMRGALGDLGEQDLNALRQYVHGHSGLGLYDKINVEEALEKTIAGRPPTEGDRLLLHRIFGKEFVNRIEQPSLGTRLARGAAEVANVPRSIESSFDVSAPLRQGLVALARHPGMTSKNVRPMLRAFRNEGAYDATMAEIAARPNYQKYRESGLAITDTHSGVMADREEFFPSNLAEKIPVAGRGVKASGRAYHGFLSKTRADLFDEHLGRATKAGYDIDDPHLTKSLATFINAATGRGEIGKLAPAARALSAAFFSPRLLASRINFLNPAWYARLHPYARKQAIRSAAQLAAFATGILELAHAAGADVETDPRSTDWAKIRVGDTRVDLLGGFQPVIRTAAQVSSGSRKTSSGEIAKLGSGFGEQSRLDIAARFFRGKLAPVPSVAADVLGGETFVGEPVTAKGEAWQRLTPFGIQDAVDVAKHTGSAPAAIGSFGLSAFGAGVQSYTATATGAKKIRQDHAELHDALERNVRKYFQQDLTPEIKRALRLREKREVYLHENLGNKATSLERYDAQIDLLLRLKKITRAQAAHAKKWSARQDKHVLSSRSAELSGKYFGGDVLSSAAKKIRDRGGKLYLSDF